MVNGEEATVEFALSNSGELDGQTILWKKIIPK
jgi:hypothetical protein